MILHDKPFPVFAGQDPITGFVYVKLVINECCMWIRYIPGTTEAFLSFFPFLTDARPYPSKVFRLGGDRRKRALDVARVVIDRLMPGLFENGFVNMVFEDSIAVNTYSQTSD